MGEMEQEFQEANADLERELWEALDRCAEKGASEDDLKLLAWQCGATQWKPSRQNNRLG